MKLAVEHMRDMVLITEAAPLDYPGPRIVYVNEAFERQTGYSSADVIGKTPRILQGARTEAAAVGLIATSLRRGEARRTELINYRKDGSEFNIEMDIVPVLDEAGRHTHWASIQRDVTARKRAEADSARRDAQRVESLGTLAAGIAHDFNNIVAAILGNVAIARQDVALGHPALVSIDQISGAALRARSMVSQILAYSQHQPQSFTAQQLAPILDEACSLLRSTMPATVSLQLVGTDDSMWLMANASQLHQVFVNLGVNAWQALPGGVGRIDVRAAVVAGPGAAASPNDPTSNDDGGSDKAMPNEGRSNDAAAAGSRAALISFSDDGCGMDATTIERVFEPYFTTKPVGNGTGLGLSVVWGIVGAHGATIEVASEPGRGSTFTLRFPLLDVPTAQAEPPAAAAVATPAATGQRVMLVDDDEVVAVTVDALLTRAGFVVETVSDPAEALATLAARPRDFQIVVTDLNMPGLSGLDLVSRMRALAVDLPVVLSSGYLSDDVRRAARDAGVARVFRKEFVAEELVELVREVLAERAAQRSPA